MRDETIPLLNKDKSEEEAKKTSEWKNSIILRTATFGANGLFFATHLILNGKYLASLGPEGASASALMSTYQSVVLGSGVGILLGTGLDFGTALGKKEYEKAGDVAKTGAILALAWGVLSASAMVSTRAFFPLLFQEETAEIASDFFTGYAGATVPLLFLIVGPQVAFQHGDWYIPPATMFSVLAASGVASYLLGFTADMGALGIGLGGTVGSAFTAAAMVAWSLRDSFKKYRFYSFHIDDPLTKMKSLLVSGWKLALQRLTEWGNLLIITTIIGAQSNSSLKALNPAMLYLVLFGTAQQGFAQAAGMVIAKNKGIIQKAIQDKDIFMIEKSHKNNIQTIFRSNLFGLLLNSAIAASFYLAKQPLTEFFLSKNTDGEISDLAENLLWISMIGLVTDAGRIIGAGNLRGWKDLLYPTIISFIFMTMIGIPAAYGLGNVFNETEMMFYVRDVAMLLSAAFILKRCHTQIKNDEIALSEYIQPPSFFRTGLSFFGQDNKPRVEEIIEPGHEQVINDDNNLRV